MITTVYSGTRMPPSPRLASEQARLGPGVSMVTKQEAVPLVKALACNNNGQIDTALPGWGRGGKGSLPLERSDSARSRIG